MFDINEVEKEAREEIRVEQAEKAKEQIKGKLAAIAKAEKVVSTLKKDYDLLLLEIGNV